MEIIDQKILHDSVRWPLSPEYTGDQFLMNLPRNRTDVSAGDIVIASGGGDIIFCSPSDYDKYQKKILSIGYDPIAVVVVPPSHTEDGTARCMGLNFAHDNDYGQDAAYSTSSGAIVNYQFGDTYDGPRYSFYVDGTTTLSVHYSDTRRDICLLTDIPDDSPNTQYSSYRYESLSGDPVAKYIYGPNIEGVVISPYGDDGVSKNDNFFIPIEFGDTFSQGAAEQISYGGPGTRMFGDETTYLSMNAGVYAQYGCLYDYIRYRTKGTNACDWYIPSYGECVYIQARFDKIQKSINACAKSQGIKNTFTDASTGSQPIYMSSYSNTTRGGSAFQFGKYGGYTISGGGHTIPFIKISPSGEVKGYARDVLKNATFLYNNSQIGTYDPDRESEIIGLRVGLGENYTDGKDRFVSFDIKYLEYMGFGKIDGVENMDTLQCIKYNTSTDSIDETTNTNFVCIPYYLPKRMDKRAFLYNISPYEDLYIKNNGYDFIDLSKSLDEKGFENTQALILNSQQYGDIFKNLPTENHYIPSVKELVDLAIHWHEYFICMMKLHQDRVYKFYREITDTNHDEVWSSTSKGDYDHWTFEWRQNPYPYIKTCDKYYRADAILFIKPEEQE